MAGVAGGGGEDFLSGGRTGAGTEIDPAGLAAPSGRFLAGSRRNAMAGISCTGAIYRVGVVVSASGEI